MYKRKKVTETDFPEFKLQNSLSNSVTLKNQSVSKVFAMARFTRKGSIRNYYLNLVRPCIPSHQYLHSPVIGL